MAVMHLTVLQRKLFLLTQFGQQTSISSSVFQWWCYKCDSLRIKDKDKRCVERESFENNSCTCKSKNQKLSGMQGTLQEFLCPKVFQWQGWWGGDTTFPYSPASVRYNQTLPSLFCNEKPSGKALLFTLLYWPYFCNQFQLDEPMLQSLLEQSELLEHWVKARDSKTCPCLGQLTE